MSVAPLLAAFVVASVGCSANGVARVDLPPTPAATAERNEPLPLPDHPPIAESGETCLMWYVCGCNLGCSKIAVPRSKLRKGLRAKVVSGTEEGETGFIFESEEGAFALSPNDPEKITVCGFPAANNIGYVCETSKSGELDAHKCDTGCP